MAYRMLLPNRCYLQACFLYDPDTGSLVWRERPRSHFKNYRGWMQWNGRHAGKEAGGVAHRPGNYDLRTVGLDYERYVVARIVYKLVTDEEPIDVDHKDTNPLNMRWTNLRPATSSKNRMNCNVRVDNVTGLKGVKYDPRHGTYMARITTAGKVTCLGTFTTPQEAHKAYCDAAVLQHKEFHRF